jgi:guanylate kinase
MRQTDFLADNEPLLVFIGPSGAGKSSVVNRLVKAGVILITPSWTTRPKRHDEKSESVEHVFVTGNKFGKLKDNGFFIETTEMFGLPFEYGLPKIEKPKTGVTPAIMLRANLLPLLLKHYSNVTIYQIEDSRERITKRLKERLVQGEAQGTRIEDIEKEIEAGRKMAKRIFLNESDIAILSDNIQAMISKDVEWQ